MVTSEPVDARPMANRGATPRLRSCNFAMPACQRTPYTGTWESPVPREPIAVRPGGPEYPFGSWDVLVVAAVDRIGRRWMDTVSTLRDLRDRDRQVRVRSLAPSEQHWTGYFDAYPDPPEAVIGDVLASFFIWAAQQELEGIRRRRKADETTGASQKLSELQVGMALRFRRDKLSLQQIGIALGVSRTTVSRYLGYIESPN